MIKKYLAVSVLFLFLLSGCGGGGTSSNEAVNDSSGNADVDGSNDDAGGGTSAGSDNTTYTPNLTLYGPFKTGKVIYETTLTSDLAGLGTLEVEGTERLVFKDWGNVSVEEKEEETTTNIVDPATGVTTTTVENKHELKKWITPKKYDVNYEQETVTVLNFGVIYENAELIADALTPIAVDNVNYVGKDVVLGYVCDVYQVGTVTMCMLNNVPMKVETDLGALGQATKVATFATFNTFVLEDEFKIPLPSTYQYIYIN